MIWLVRCRKCLQKGACWIISWGRHGRCDHVPCGRTNVFTSLIGQLNFFLENPFIRWRLISKVNWLIKGSCPSIIGPALPCHHKDEKMGETAAGQHSWRLSWIGRVFGCGWCGRKKALANQTTAKFSLRYLLLCSVHTKKNVRSKLLDLVNVKAMRNSVFNEIFGFYNAEGLIRSGRIWWREGKMYKFEEINHINMNFDKNVLSD